MSDTTADVTAEDMFQSLTGFDELAIAKAFGEDISSLRHKPFRFLRALVFVHKRRAEGVKDPQAYQATQELTMRQLEAYFVADEPMAEETDLGKDAPPST